MFEVSENAKDGNMHFYEILYLFINVSDVIIKHCIIGNGIFLETKQNILVFIQDRGQNISFQN